jgi:hypothetical protein
MSDIGYAFLSYSSKNQDFADAMREVLIRNGLKVWMAPGDIPAGSKYADVINKAIKNCGCVILMLSEASQNSVWVAREVERAIHNRKPIVPVQIESVLLNDTFEFFISTDQIVAVKRIDDTSVAMQKVLSSVAAILQTGPEKDYFQIKPEHDDIAKATKVMIKEPGFEFKLSYKYSGSIYFRCFEKSNNDIEYSFRIDEKFTNDFFDLLNSIYRVVLGANSVTTRFKWLDEKDEYVCKEIPEREYENRDDSCKADFRIVCLEHCESRMFDSFEIGLRRNDFYILLYKHGGPGGYAYYGIDPNTPLSYFGIDENKLIDSAKALIQFAYPNKTIVFAQKFHREDSSVNNSGAVYNRFSFIID